MATEYPTGRPTIDYPFAPIPKDLLYDTKVSSTAVRIYGVLARFAYEEGANNLQVTHEEIAGRLGYSARSIARPLADLEARGWIERQTCNTWLGRTADFFHLNSQRAESRTGVGAQRAKSRTRDRADSRGLTTPKEGEILTSTSEPQPLPMSVPAAPSKEQLEADFSEWYDEYPRKKKPADARRAYVRARKIATKDELLLGAQMLARLVKNQQQELKFTPYPASWLNGECWREPEEKEPERNPFEGPEMRYA